MTEENKSLPAPIRSALPASARQLMTIDEAVDIAKKLKRVIGESKDGTYVVRVKHSEHPKVEAWATLAGLAGGYYAKPEQPKPIYSEKDELLGYRVRAVLRREGSDEELGEGWGRCDFSEQLTRKDGTTYDRWSRSEPFAVESMAQTRARSKCFRNRFDWVAVLAGYSGTPFEEMEQIASREEPKPKKVKITDRARRELFESIENHANEIAVRSQLNLSPAVSKNIAHRAIRMALDSFDLLDTKSIEPGQIGSFALEAKRLSEQLFDEELGFKPETEEIPFGEEQG